MLGGMGAALGMGNIVDADSCCLFVVAITTMRYSLPPLRSVIETLILTVTSGVIVPMLLWKENVYHNEFYANLIIAWFATFVTFTMRKKPRSWEESSRNALDSGIMYGTALVSLAISSHLLLIHHQTPAADKGDEALVRHIRLNFWCSFACSFNALVEMVLDQKNESFINRAFRCVLIIAILIPNVLEIHRYGQYMYLTTCTILFECVAHAIRKGLKKSFTIGEALLVAQLLSLAATDYLAQIASKVSPRSTLYYRTHRRPLDVTLQGGLLGVVMLAFVLSPLFRRYAVTDNETKDVDPRSPRGAVSHEDSSSSQNNNNKKKKTNKSPPSNHVMKPSPASGPRFLEWTSLPFLPTLQIYTVIFVHLFLFVAPVVGFVLGENPVSFVYEAITADATHGYMLAYWGACLAVGLPFINLVASRRWASLIVVRKLYHIQALVMFGPAVHFDRDFLALGFGLATAVFLGVEYVRVCRLPPWGEW